MTTSDRSVLPYMKERAGSTDPTRRFVPEGVAVVLCKGARQLSKPGSMLAEPPVGLGIDAGEKRHILL